MGLHAAAAGGVLIQPPLWPSALAAVAANHAFLTALGLWPRSTLLGPNLTRLPEAARVLLVTRYDPGATS